MADDNNDEKQRHPAPLLTLYKEPQYQMLDRGLWIEDRLRWDSAACRVGEEDRVIDVIDLSPLLAEVDAAEMLLRARGQLNRAFRSHGLFSPDPLPVTTVVNVRIDELDDPTADGVAQARARYRDTFDIWARKMPVKLVEPVLEILRQTHEALSEAQEASEAARHAVMRAYEFLAERAPADRSGAGNA